MASEDLSQRRLEAAVGSWAPQIRYLDETGSTNSDALEWAAQGASEGAIVVADLQTAGRGRLGRSWFGKPGASIHLSVILRPRIGVEEIGLINLAAAAAVARALRNLEVDARIKWPNDVLIGDRKVCGILSEAQFERGVPSSVVLGVGINVNLETEDFPTEIASTATSLLVATGHRFDRVEIITGFLGEFGGLYSALPGKPGHILDAYRPLCVTLGRRVKIEGTDKSIEGDASDVDSTGALVLESGEIVRVGDVVHLR